MKCICYDVFNNLLNSYKTGMKYIMRKPVCRSFLLSYLIQCVLIRSKLTKTLRLVFHTNTLLIKYLESK